MPIKKLSNKEKFGKILEYVYKISKLVSPYDAKRHFNFRHDGAVCETLGELALLFEDGMTIDKIMSRLNKDEFYSDIINRMIEDVNKEEN